MSDNLMDKVSSLGERLKISGAEVGKKMTASMSSMSVKMKELFQGSNQAEKIVEEATAETLDEPDWAMNLEICDMINHKRVNSIELIRGIKKKIMLKNHWVQFLALMLLETVVKNCDKAFSELAAERVLDEMVKLIDDPQTIVNNRNKASLRSRGIRFPGRDNESLAPIFTPPRSVSEAETNAAFSQLDIPVQALSPEQTKEAFDVARNSVELLSTVLSSSPQQDVLQDELTMTLVEQCRQSETIFQRIIETVGENEALLFEAWNVNDEIQKALSKFEDLKTPPLVHREPEPAMIPVSAIDTEESPCEKTTGFSRCFPWRPQRQ
ncbi:TOM1-like protein [Drosera capensis]